MPSARADEMTRQVQEELRKRNLYFGDVDGCISEQVVAALRFYQQRKGFAATGLADETTLRSLNLRPAPETSASDPSAASSVAAVHASPSATPIANAATPVPWPDLAVLRSDQAWLYPPGANDPGASGDTPHLTGTPAPPPAAAAVRRPNLEDVRAFLTRYLQAGESNETERQMPFYGEKVNYFDGNTVDLRYIKEDIDRYDRRWPQRHFTLLEPITLADSPDGDPGRIVVNFHYRLDVKRPGHDVKGETQNTYTLAGSVPEDLHIIALREQRVRGK